MKRLTETALFSQLSLGDATTPTNAQLRALYDDFACAVVAVCSAPDNDTPAYFTLNYTRSEFDQLTLAASAKGAGKKMLRQKSICISVAHF